MKLVIILLLLMVVLFCIWVKTRNPLKGYILHNLTDGSKKIISTNTKTTITTKD